VKKKSPTFELTQNNWFATPVWHGIIPNVDLFNFKQHILDIKKSDPNGVTKTNFGGWQSQTHKSNFGSLFGLMAPLKSALNLCKKELLGDYHKEPVMQDYWFNINEFGDYNTMHNHHNALLSGVFYIDVPDENMGQLYFERDDHINYYIPEDVASYNHAVGTKIEYKPIAGNLVIFPSWLKHAVEGNRSKKSRMSMSFNCGFK
jgi:uncharacterized protein (TIGR02466 family)|tara:strand:+ start:182 stop:790 length:609 start_codon:yes stop_codon:yes gene_type:complete